MKEMNLYSIRELALKSGRAVYSVQQLANLIKKQKAIAAVYSSRLVAKGLARRLLKGKISFAEDDFIVASQLVEPSYISLSSALAFHNILSQVPANVECVSPKNSRRYGKLGLVYHKIPPSLFFGYEKYRKGDSYVFVAEPEKALIDGIYLNLLPKNVLAEAMAGLDKNKLAGYVRRYAGRGKKKLERWLL